MTSVITVPAATAAHTASAPEVDTLALPKGFPSKVESKMAWVGKDFVNSETFVYNLNQSDLEEINAAIDHFKTLGLDAEQVTRATFPLKELGAKLDELSTEVHSGRGFCLVRGIKPTDYSVSDLTLVYLGVQTYIANLRAKQDNRGNMLVHIIADRSSKMSTEHHRHSSKSITFHTEETGDVVSWLTRNTASSGGRCVISSAHTIYNALAESRPDLVRLLARSDWPFVFPKFNCRPILFNEGSNIIMNFGRTPLLGNSIHPRPERFPSVSAAQLEALDAVEAIARATELEIATQAGDMHFINNLALLHRRESFEDNASTMEKRHLVRMRLRSAQHGWDIPKELQSDWNMDFDEDHRHVWHFDPKPESFFPLRKYPN